MKNRNLLSIKKLAVLGICVSFVAGGCGKMTESSIPKLEEPVALNEAYRPVEYGTIGSLQVLMATAVPRDYCNYYSANVNISQIYVEPGDTVNAGDVLAVCDVDEAKKQLQECKDALVHENETYEISAQISDTQIKLWESQAADTDEFSTEQIEKKRAQKMITIRRLPQNRKMNGTISSFTNTACKRSMSRWLYISRSLMMERLRQSTAVLSLTLRS